MAYNRQFKKLAGPSFQVNVRFDDSHVRLCKTGGSAVAVNNRGFDKIHSPELFDVKEGEILLAKKQSHCRDGFARCFSSLNGFQVQNGNSLGDLQNQVYNDCVFIGVASTDFKSDNAGYMDQGFVAQVAGVVTMKHEGKETLHPGDLVGYAIPDNHYRKVRKGIPPYKERLVLVKAPPQLDGNIGDADLKEILKARTRVIGKAMSYSKTGDTVDILLLPRANH